jgi:hypothetical protein
MCRLSRSLGASTSWNPKGLSRPIMGLLYLLIQQVYCSSVYSCFRATISEKHGGRTPHILIRALDGDKRSVPLSVVCLYEDFMGLTQLTFCVYKTAQHSRSVKNSNAVKEDLLGGTEEGGKTERHAEKRMWDKKGWWWAIDEKDELRNSGRRNRRGHSRLK